MTENKMVFHALSNTGRVRNHNEDAFYIGTTVGAVADGMGGHAAGEVASNLALTTLHDLDGVQFDSPQDATDALANAVHHSNTIVVNSAYENPGRAGMGTTLTAILLQGNDLHIAHVGDSRAYLFRDGVLTQLTSDHSLVNHLVMKGTITAEEARVHPRRSVITRAIGTDTSIEVDTFTTPLILKTNDRVLLCTDGLSGPVIHERMESILKNEPNSVRVCVRLIDAANNNGGPDNITVVVLDVLGSDREDDVIVTHDNDVTVDLIDPSLVRTSSKSPSKSALDRAFEDYSIEDTDPDSGNEITDAVWDMAESEGKREALEEMFADFEDKGNVNFGRRKTDRIPPEHADEPRDADSESNADSHENNDETENLNQGSNQQVDHDNTDENASTKHDLAENSTQQDENSGNESSQIKTSEESESNTQTDSDQNSSDETDQGNKAGLEQDTHSDQSDGTDNNENADLNQGNDQSDSQDQASQNQDGTQDGQESSESSTGDNTSSSKAAAVNKAENSDKNADKPIVAPLNDNNANPKGTVEGLSISSSNDKNLRETLQSNEVEEPGQFIRSEKWQKRFVLWGGTILGIIVALIPLLGFILSTQFFVSTTNTKEIAVYQGVHSEVFGIPLYKEVSTSSLTLDSLPKELHESISEGVTLGSREAAEEYISETLDRAARKFKKTGK